MLYLRIQYPDGRASVVHIASGGLRLGRQGDNDVVLAEYGVSRHHAEVRVAEGQVYVRDLGSRNGTLVCAAPDARERLLRGGADGKGPDEAKVAPGDEIRVGSVRLVLGESLGEPPAEGLATVAADPPGPAGGTIVELPSASDLETLNLSAGRAVELLDFLARFAGALSGKPTSGLAGEGLSRLLQLSRAERIEVFRRDGDRPGDELILAAAAGAPRDGPDERERRVDAFVRSVLERSAPVACWWDGGEHAEAALATPVGDGTVLVLGYAVGAARPTTEELRSLEVAAAIAGQTLRLAAAADALERSNRRLATDVAAWRQSARRLEAPAEIVAASEAMRGVLEEAARAAAWRRPVVLAGETGVGKEVVARFIHDQSPWKDGHFVAVNCATLDDELFLSEMFGHRRGSFTGALADKVGLVEAAAGGTLFLDEVAELTPSGQARLLRWLEEGTYRRVGDEAERRSESRVIAASNRDLDSAVKSGSFREDLRFRLEVVSIRIPPLARRREDILPLARRFLQTAFAEHGLHPPELDVEASRLLHAWDWPGNVRELRNVIDRAAVLATGPVVRASDLRFAPASSPSPDLASLLGLGREQALEGFKRLYYERLLLACDGNVSRAARAAGMERRNLQQAIARYRLRRPGEPAAPGAGAGDEVEADETWS